MTFKHTKFDSETFRSLEKIALEKGLIKSEPVLIKQASKVDDLKPTNDLMHNIIKLCTGLRNSGFDKQANEVETKFFAFKQANSLYDVSKETGEDLVNAAHPKGSYKLLDVDGDGLVETILDQHLRGLDVANKKPTGKLSNAMAIQAIKIVCAQDKDFDENAPDTEFTSRQEELNKRKNYAFTTVKATANLLNLVDSEFQQYKPQITFFGKGSLLGIEKNISEAKASLNSINRDHINQESIDNYKTDINDIRVWIQGNNISVELQKTLNGYLSKILAGINKAERYLVGAEAIPTKKVVTDGVNIPWKSIFQQDMSKAQTAVDLANEGLNTYANKLTPSDVSKINAFITLFSRVKNDLFSAMKRVDEFSLEPARMFMGTANFGNVTDKPSYDAAQNQLRGIVGRYNAFIQSLNQRIQPGA